MIGTLKGGQEQHTDEGGRITIGRVWGLKLYTTEHMGTSEWGGTGKTFLEPKEERGTARACMRT